MASTPEQPLNKFSAFFQSPLGSNLALGIGIALVASIMAAVWLWAQKPDYRILLSNFSDRDGGAIIAALQQMNVPYQFAEGGGAILVPADRIYDARLKLAAQGLPKGVNVGFELMENQKLGVSQFLEQVNFQRALEGELARSINSIAVVQSSRVHLAIPKPTVFVREKQHPTASVLLNLHPGRTLDAQQVNAIIHLVSSSVPELSPKNVTIVDQNGALLSDLDDPANSNHLDPNQLKYVQELQGDIVRRIESILSPMLGPENIRAEATAEIDFSRSEQAAESYKPNTTPDSVTKRSEHINESKSTEADKAGGIPGAGSNQPAQTAQQQNNGTAPSPTNSQKENTINYEVDKTVRYVQQPMGNIKRLTVAVLVNNKTETGEDGKPVSKPLSDTEKEQITGLIREAMGFNKDRGDSLNVVNTAFTIPPKEQIPEIALWKQLATLENGKTAGQYLLAGLVILFLYLNILRPLLRRVTPLPQTTPHIPSSPPEIVQEPQVTESIDEPQHQINQQQNELETVKHMAAADPRMVANVIKNWINE
jgi:flagellar M-ring protein FliF